MSTDTYKRHRRAICYNNFLNFGIAKKEGSIGPIPRFDGRFDKMYKAQPKVINLPKKLKLSPKDDWYTSSPKKNIID